VNPAETSATEQKAFGAPIAHKSALCAVQQQSEPAFVVSIATSADVPVCAG